MSYTSTALTLPNLQGTQGGLGEGGWVGTLGPFDFLAQGSVNFRVTRPIWAVSGSYKSLHCDLSFAHHSVPSHTS